MDPQPGGSGITTANFYRNGRVYRPRVMHQFLCSSDTEDIVEHVVDEVEDAYSPHESEEEPSSDGEEFPDDTVVLEIYMQFNKILTNHLEVPKRKQMSLCEFKLKLAASLLRSGKSRGEKRKPSSNVTNAAYITKKKTGRATKPILDKDIRLDM
ncbi:uncharacterized protein LOC119572823 [Penaeus monodon]|uniref:uncharacterized protein LOC119572823 n=1 Tax=Penaeus monodon TaxID=6687 RepID=UPI0018A7BECF|nr:uncharacterized protein LOC119572823 [Penaeus monodon]